jgi:hypothetical protein
MPDELNALNLPERSLLTLDLSDNFKNNAGLNNMNKITLDYSLIDNLELDINTSDAPDFADSYIVSATYDGRDMTDAELDVLNDDSDYVYSAVERQLY